MGVIDDEPRYSKSTALVEILTKEKRELEQKLQAVTDLLALYGAGKLEEPEIEHWLGTGREVTHFVSVPDSQGNCKVTPIGEYLTETALSSKVVAALNRGGIHTLKELSAFSESQICRFRNIGPIGLQDIKQVLAGAGLSLRE